MRSLLLPPLGSTMYLVGQMVTVQREYPEFGLSKICYVGDSEDFIIDTELLTTEPIAEHTISIHLLRGYKNDT